jgi:uncharacterized protein YwqG
MNWLKKFFPKAMAPKITSSESDDNASDLLRRFGHLAKPAIHLRPMAQIGFSKLGGLPALPPGIDWPLWNEKPQSFLAQIDLAEINAVLPSFLPSSGRLYFFYDQAQEAWGFDPKDRGAWQVFYSTASESELQERVSPTDLPDEFVYKTKYLCPVLVDLLPDSQMLPSADFDWDRDGEEYEELRSSVFGGDRHHQILGYPTPIQNPGMEEQCQLASNGIYVGNSDGYNDPRVPQLKAGAGDWKLLLQLDSDEETGWMWGDVGTVYFWIREQDARKADFSKVWMVFQCG